MTDRETDVLLSVAQAASVLGVHPNTIRAWTDGGRLTAYRINSRGDRRFRRSDVLRLLVEDGTSATPEAATPERSRSGVAFLGRIASGLATTPTAAGVARTIVEALRVDVGAERAAVYLAHADGYELLAHAGFGMAPPAALVGGDAVSAEPGDSVLELAARGGPVGRIVVDEAAHDAMGPALVAALTAVASTALASARLLHRARRDLQRSRALGAVARELAGELDLDRVLDDIIERTRTLLGADRAGLWLFDDTQHPVALVTRGLSSRFLTHAASLTKGTRSIATDALRDGRARWSGTLADPSVGAMRPAYEAEGIRSVCIAPLRARGRAIGVIGLYHDAERSWPAEEIELVQAFADQAAVAVQNARLYAAAADQATRMRSIQDLSGRLNRLTDVRSIGQAIVTEARTLADYHDIRIYRVDRERGVCEPIAFTREMLNADAADADAESLLRVRIGEGFTGWVAEHGEPLLINDALDDPRGKTIEGTDDVPESMLVVPMLYEGEALGVIVLSQLGNDRFTEHDLATMRIFAGYAAQAMANAASYERLVAQSAELARRADSQRRLLEINERLLTLDEAGVLEAIADGLRDVVAYDNLSIYRADHVVGAMVPVLTRERHAEEVSRYIIPFGRGLMGWAVEHAQPILANDALADPRALQIPGTPADPEAVVVVPLVAEGKALGALNVSRVGGEEVYFSDSDFELVQLFAAQASIALSNADAHQEVSVRAETDALTGLGNHGAFQRELARTVDAAADDRRVAVLMMDLDQFKAYNDRHGHPAGDALLHHVATTIYGAARSEDRVYRYGGDEFAVILPGASAAAATRVAERIRRAVGRITATDVTPVTITIGVAAYPADARDRAGLIGAADAALFYGKRSGENQVVRHDALPRDIEERRETLEALTTAALHDPDLEGDVGDLVDRAERGEPGARDGLDAALAVARITTSGDAADREHAARVGWLAERIAAVLGLDDAARRRVELAGRLHAIGDAEIAELNRHDAMRPVLSLVTARRRIVADGRRRGRRGRRAAGALAAHAVGVTDAYDRLVSGLDGERIGRAEAIVRLRRDPATWRPEVIDALASVVSQGEDGGRRRRRSDVRPDEDRGAA